MRPWLRKLQPSYRETSLVVRAQRRGKQSSIDKIIMKLQSKGWDGRIKNTNVDPRKKSIILCEVKYQAILFVVPTPSTKNQQKHNSSNQSVAFYTFLIIASIAYVH